MAGSTVDKKETFEALNIYQKLARITGEVGVIAKTGQSSGYGDKYNFIEYGMVAGRLRDLFAKYGVVVVPRMQQAFKQSRSEITSKSGTKGYVVLIDFTFNVVNADKPEDKFTVTWTGEAADYGDKATNKAATAALKYYLMRQFNISEKGDDPDGETHEVAEVVRTASSSEPSHGTNIRVASEKQIGLIKTLAKRAGHGDDWFASVLMKIKTSADASAIIDKLQATIDGDQPTEREYR